MKMPEEENLPLLSLLKLGTRSFEAEYPTVQ
jgi:hypothetical protein